VNKVKNTLIKRIFIVNILLLVVTNVVLGAVMLYRSRITSKALIDARVLDVANCAAASVNGDILKTLTAQDKGTENYQLIENSLIVFRDNITLEYIYCIAQKSETEFVFTIDPSLGDPGKFGDPVVYTEALAKAAKGTPSVDATPYTDAWGTFYSAYSPIYDSEKNIVGIVGVDFAAEFYEKELTANTGIILAIFTLSLAASIIVLFVSTRQIRHGFSQLYNEMSALSDDINTLTKDTPENAAAAEQDAKDEITDIIFKTRSMHNVIRSYLVRVKSEARRDGLTGVGNRTLFAETMENLNERIKEETADFAIAIFDINGLKVINDEHGHDEGDKIIEDAAAALKETFGAEPIYRIGGDEFIAVLEETPLEEADNLLERLDRNIETVNKSESRKKIPLAISKGAAAYRKGVDKDFNAVFKRADNVMYHDKAAYYLRHGDRRKKKIDAFLNESEEENT